MEWRALVFNRFRQIPICGARVIDVADIPEDAIECVVLGQRIGADDEKEIRSCIAPNIKIYRCQADPLSYSLKLIEA